jgi:hypothetical protein
LESVVRMNGKGCGQRMPVRDSEIIQKEPFTHQTAKVTTDDGGNEMGEAMEMGV